MRVELVTQHRQLCGGRLAFQLLAQPDLVLEK
jgi:hypothetical protein